MTTSPRCCQVQRSSLLFPLASACRPLHVPFWTTFCFSSRQLGLCSRRSSRSSCFTTLCREGNARDPSPSHTLRATIGKSPLGVNSCRDLHRDPTSGSLTDGRRRSDRSAWPRDGALLASTCSIRSLCCSSPSGATTQGPKGETFWRLRGVLCSKQLAAALTGAEKLLH